jgi:hypothetical protein
MKTLQKTIWIKCLIIGIISSSLLLNSCDTITEYRLTTNFIYKNLTLENVEIILYNQDGINFNKYVIEPNEEVKVVIIGDGPKTGINSPFLTNSTSDSTTKVVIKFNVSSKCLTFIRGEGILNIKSYDNFTESMNNTSNNTLIYNIDAGELDLATTCP